MPSIKEILTIKLLDSALCRVTWTKGDSNNEVTLFWLKEVVAVPELMTSSQIEVRKAS